MRWVHAPFQTSSDNDESHPRIITLKKSNMSRSIRILLNLTLVIVLVCLSVGGYSQDLEDPSTLDPAVPVDGGISLLLAAGAALGGRKLFMKSRESKD